MLQFTWYGCDRGPLKCWVFFILFFPSRSRPLKCSALCFSASSDSPFMFLASSQVLCSVTSLTQEQHIKPTQPQEQQHVLHMLQKLKMQEEHVPLDLELLKAERVVQEKIKKEELQLIMELKGKVRVFVRVRPLPPDEAAKRVKNLITFSKAIKAGGQGVDLHFKGKVYHFPVDERFF
ncbi:kinesin-like protein KIN-14C isoform X2 [Quercus robur]|uniref:kinesin-like protein KIN-14C isoform X2 n=1 Tax=Quercus robur TaxID=38942 RepID=UPI0021631C85|nr:kinesin-like protein KIN-14C isoform X2 [Quercus robur]XP_050254363.1 kinesin-like protein KIN-14C isoform X2 [Quercus robur]XP_050254364.1 kinesin-like protein KIN-14C isoform X2 [Quercus robur]XP_050254365.1 kinesin-like protein KIN-14C isoform X2 [Quercus robur]XP_050254366.1 kinesin-like protein KIN-14C isoform X2 [Quercus robur]XP_050254367.1 kinesin-like protein KIN-14C isoform X2 [Quercus robur]XP_050254368.1 kinesin-like protein KIN-14C isoform X2 [Quercus robur]XP_050254369.1 kin